MGEDWLESIKLWVAEKGVEFAANLLGFLAVLIIGAIVIKIILRISGSALQRSSKVNEVLERFFQNVLHKVLWIVVLVVALSQLGVDVAPLIAGLGIGGFILGFAFQETLGNLSAGLMLLINQPFNIGDYVEAGGSSGTVKDLNIMATTLATPDNKRVTIPNNQIWGSGITNYSAYEHRRVDLVIGISYDADIGRAIQVIEQVLKDNEMVLDEPEWTIGVAELADSSVNFYVRPWCDRANYFTVMFDVTRQIKEAFDAAGIGIPFPQLDLHVVDMPDGDEKKAA